MKFLKSLIRNLYWKYGHNGDKWQMRLVHYHMGLMLRTDTTISNGEFIIAQLNKATGKMDLISECRIPAFKDLTGIDNES